MKKRGFTLIELLAVIVILAIIALIAVPVVSNVILSVKKNTFEQTIEGIARSTDVYKSKVGLTNPITECRYFSFDNDVTEIQRSEDGKLYYPLKDLNLKGNIPTEGEIKICKKEIEIIASDCEYAGKYEEENVIVLNGCLSDNDLENPIISLINTNVSTRQIEVFVNAHSKKGEDLEKYYYKINDGEYIETTKNNYIFKDLEPGKEYTIQVKVENKSGIQSKEDKNSIIKVTTGTTKINFESSQVPANTNYAQYKQVLVRFASTNVTKTQYYVKPTVAVTSSVNGYSCGTEGAPSTCSTTVTKSFKANTWYKVTSNPTLKFTANGIVYARINDGNIYSSASSYQVTKIDASEPILSVSSIKKSTTTMVIPYTASDNDSGITNTTCYYGTSTNYGSSVTGSNGKCNITGLTSNKTYYYKVETTNGSGLTKTVTGNSKTGSTGIEYTVSQTPTGTTYAQNKALKVTYTATNVTSPVYYFKSSVSATVASGVVTQACGTGDAPGTCTSSSVTTLVANTWYKTTSKTPTITFKVNGTLYVRINDGNSYSSASSYQITKIDTSAPSLSVSSVTKSTTTMTINYTASDTESNITSTTCYYGTSTSYGNSVTGNNGKCNITGLTSNKIYYYKVETTNGSGLKNTTAVTGNSKTGTTGISYSVTQAPIGTTYAQSKALTVTYTATNVTSPIYYVKSTVAVTSNVNGYSCGTGNAPSTCGSTATKSFAANTWYKVASNPTLTFKANGTLYARINDGNSYSSASSYLIEQIDASTPGVATIKAWKSSAGTAVSSGTWSNEWISFSLEGSNATSGIDHYLYCIDTTNTCTPSTKYTGHFYVDSSKYIRYRAVSGSGKNGTIASFQALIDGTLPTVSYSASASGSYMTVTVTGSDTNFSYMHVHVYKDGTFVSAKSTSNTTSKTFSVSLDSTGSWIVYAQVYDKAGNKHNKLPDNGGGWYYQSYGIYGYTGGAQSFTAPVSGTYQLKVWGAAGGTSATGYAGGLGGYSYGNVSLTAGQTIYIYVGGAGSSNTTGGAQPGGYNGGGQAGTYSNNSGGSGGGATHIGTRNGLLKDYGNKSGLYIVAGGGGGGGTAGYTGGSGGGASGSAGGGTGGTGGTQTSAGVSTDGYGITGSFGEGSYSVFTNGAGGGGLYGGAGTAALTGGGGGGGSGYIGGVSSGSTSNGIRSGNGLAHIVQIS